MRERELLDALLSESGNVPLICRGELVYWGSEVIGELREGQFHAAESEHPNREEAELLQDVITWKLRKDLSLRRLLRPRSTEASAPY